MQKDKIYTLGFMSYCSHDPAAALIEFDGTKISNYLHFEEGMLSRKKKSYHFPLRSIYKCLKYTGIEIQDLSLIATDFMDNKSYMATSDSYRLLVGDYIRENLNILHSQLSTKNPHHDAHAYSAFYASDFSEAAILSIDGLGSEQTTHSIYVGNKQNGIKKIFEQRLPGIGELYTLLTLAIGFEAGEEGKTMGLAPYGSNINKSDLKKIQNQIKGRFDGLTTDYSKQVQRAPSTKLKIKLDKKRLDEDLYKGYPAIISYALQKELENALVHLSKEIKKTTGLNNLCIAGGVGLNCVANEMLVNKEIFDNIYVHADSGDSGLPLGLALIGLEQEMERRGNSKKNIQAALCSFNYPKFGKGYKYNDKNTGLAFLKKNKIELKQFEPEIIANKLIKNDVVALFSDDFELGPRALGHRSFLASPLSEKMKEIMNRKIKHREAYRPFAPIVTEKNFKKFFISKHMNHDRMLYAVQCTDNAKKHIPATVHYDNTARVQVISDDNEPCYKIINKFEEISGVGVLINTSFNDNDEPIVLDEIDALSCFLRTNADVLVLNDFFIDRGSFGSKEDIERHLIELEKIIRLRSKKIYSEAIDMLLNQKPSRTLDSFKRESLITSEYMKKYHSISKLKKLISSNKLQKYNKIYSDEYHFIILQNIFAFQRLDFESIRNKIVTLSDDYESLYKIDLNENNLILLYNISTIIRHTNYQEGHLATIFYDQPDRVIILDNNLKSFAYDPVFKTYELDNRQSINTFFKSDFS